MVKSCSAYNCAARSTPLNTVSFHRFPAQPNLRELWIRATKRDKFTPSKHSVLCSVHFKESDYLRIVPKKVLKKDAVPSIFQFPKHLKKLEKTRRLINRNPNCLPDSGSGEIETEREQPSTSTSTITGQTNIRRKRLYFGDFTENDLKCFKNAKLMWVIAKRQISYKNKQLKILRVKNTRLKKRVVTLKNLVQNLRESNRITHDCEFLLNKSI